MMKYILVITFIFSSILFASNTTNDKAQKLRLEKQILIEIEKEKRHAKEQVFHNSDTYDFKGSEVNPESLKSLPEIEDDDFNIDSVYD